MYIRQVLLKHCFLNKTYPNLASIYYFILLEGVVVMFKGDPRRCLRRHMCSWDLKLGTRKARTITPILSQTPFPIFFQTSCQVVFPTRWILQCSACTIYVNLRKEATDWTLSNNHHIVNYTIFRKSRIQKTVQGRSSGGVYGSWERGQNYSTEGRALTKLDLRYPIWPTKHR